MTAYPRIYISMRTHDAIRKASKKLGKPMNKIGNAIAIAGLKALGYPTR